MAAIVSDFDLPEPVQSAIHKEEVLAVVQAAFAAAIADKRLTADEEAQITSISANLGVTITDDAKSEQNLERFRLLARIDNGQLTALRVPIILQRGEACHATLACSMHERPASQKLLILLFRS